MGQLLILIILMTIIIITKHDTRVTSQSSISLAGCRTLPETTGYFYHTLHSGCIESGTSKLSLLETFQIDCVLVYKSSTLPTSATILHITVCLAIRVQNCDKINKVITTMVNRPLDDCTYCARSRIIHLGLWQKLYDCSWHHFRARKSVFKRDLLILLSISNHLSVI